MNDQPLDSSPAAHSVSGGKATSSKEFKSIADSLAEQLRRDFFSALAPVQETLRTQNPIHKLEEFRVWMESLAGTLNQFVSDTRVEVPRLREELEAVKLSERAAQDELRVLLRERDELRDQLVTLQEKYNQLLVQAFNENNTRGDLWTTLGPQHDELERQFQGVKQAVSRMAQKVLATSTRTGAERHQATAEFRVLVSAHLLSVLTQNSDPKKIANSFLLVVGTTVSKLLNQSELQQLAQDWQSFLKQITIASPRGVVLQPEVGTLFDPSCHEAQRGYEEAGAITQVVFPGYALDTAPRRVYVKADVLTDRPGT